MSQPIIVPIYELRITSLLHIAVVSSIYASKHREHIIIFC